MHRSIFSSYVTVHRSIAASSAAMAGVSSGQHPLAVIRGARGPWRGRRSGGPSPFSFHLHFTFTIIYHLKTVKLCIIPSQPPILYLATTHYCTLYVYAGDDMTYFYIIEHMRQ